MPNIPCKPVLCPGTDLETDPPVINYSTEAPDNVIFVATGFPWWTGNNPLGKDGPHDPGFPPAYFAEGCISLCFSPTSQEAANLCAQAQAFICSHTPPGGGGGGQALFFNEFQQCHFACTDGNDYVWTVLAGQFYSTTQALANSIAQAYACQQAARHFICLSDINTKTCLNQPYLNSVVASGHGREPIVISVMSGTLPAGLHIAATSDTTAEISGTPTSPGNFDFTLKATDADGNFALKSYTISVLGISNINSLPDAMENTAYNTQLNAVGGTGPYTFTLVSGSVPGITLSTSGLLSGTPDYVTAGNYPITVRVRDSNGNTCQYDSTIRITLRPGPDWTQLVWTQYVLVQGGAGSSCSGAAVANTAFANVQWAGVLPFAHVHPASTAALIYTGPAVTARMRLTVSFSATGGSSNNLGAELLRNAIQIGGYGGSAFTSGTYEFDIPIPLSVGASLVIDDIGGGFDWAECTGVGGNASLSMTWAIFNV